MNTVLVKEAPYGDFEEVTIQNTSNERFLQLIQEHKAIKYDVYHMPNLTKEIKDALGKQGYYKAVLERDLDKHFLVPRNLAQSLAT